MKKLFKIILYSLLIVVVLIITAIIVLPRIINPNDYKVDIADLVEKHTGRELSIDGDIRLSVFPWLGFEIGEVHLHNPPQYKDATFLKLQGAKAHIRLLSLFSDELEIGQLELLSPELHLQQTASGNNWSDLFETRATETDAPKPASEITQRPARRFRVDGIDIRDATFHWQDQTTAQTVTLSHLNLHAGPLSQEQLPLQLELLFDLPDMSLTGNLGWQSLLHFDLDKQHFVLSDVVLEVNARGKSLPEGQQFVALRIPTLVLDTPAQQVDIKAFTLTNRELQLAGKVQVSQWEKPQIRFELETGKLDINRFLPKPDGTSKPANTTAATMDKTPTLPATLDVQGNVRIEALQVLNYQIGKMQVPLTIKNSKVRLQPVVQLYGGELQGDWQINTQTQPLRWQLQSSLRGVDMAPLVQAVSGKDHVRGKAEIDTRLTTEGLDLATLQQHLNGEASVRIAQPQLINLDLQNWLFGKWYDKFKKPRPPAAHKEVTVFDELRASATIRNGVIDNPDLLAQAERYHLTGKGQVNLVKQNLDYTVNYIPKTSYVFSIDNHDHDLKDESLPIVIKGEWTNLKIDPEIDEVVKRLLKRSVQRKVDTQQESVKEHVEEKKQQLKDKLLKKLLK